MSEERRVVVAVVLCVAIFLMWKNFLDQRNPPPQPAQNPAVTQPLTPQQATPGAANTEKPVPANAEVRADTTQNAIPETRLSFKNNLFSGEISSRDAAFTQLELLTYKEKDAGQVSLVTGAIDAGVRQAALHFNLGDKNTPALTLNAVTNGYELHGKNDVVSIYIKVTPRTDAYAFDYEVAAQNLGPAPLAAGLSLKFALQSLEGESSGGFLTPPPDLVHGICANSEKVWRKNAADLKEGSFSNNGQWAGLDRQYFVVGLLSPAGEGACQISHGNNAVLVNYQLGATEQVAPGQNFNRKFTLYAGPKRLEELEKVHTTLRDVIDYNIWKIPLGAIARPMVYFLNLFHGWTASWGLAIILLTLLVKTLLFPVTYKSAQSMRKMQLVKPELDRLKTQFGNDRERMQMEQMKLFREKGVNPLGGCLPMLLQMPVWFALYRCLWTSVDLYQQKFLWLSDLTAKEAFPFLSIAFGGLTIVQQRLTPMSMDSQQTKVMMYVMPVMFAFFMIPLPSGLVLYIVVNSILTILQQLAINKRLTSA